MTGEKAIIITFEKLAQYLEEVERSEQDSRTGTVKAIPVGMRKRKRKREKTPPEELSISNERRFAQQEEVAERLANEEDEEWKETS